MLYPRIRNFVFDQWELPLTPVPNLFVIYTLALLLIEEKVEPITVNEFIYYFSLLRSYSTGQNMFSKITSNSILRGIFRMFSTPLLFTFLDWCFKCFTFWHWCSKCFTFWHWCLQCFTFWDWCLLLLLHVLLLLTRLPLQLLRLSRQSWYLQEILCNSSLLPWSYPWSSPWSPL